MTSNKFIGQGLTYDDVLLVPAYSETLPREVSIKSRFSRNIPLNIPIISMLDSNCDPDLIDIPIPGNDDAISSIKIILEALTDSIRLGRQV